MTANEHMAKACPTLDAETRQRIMDTAYPDRGDCTGDELLCRCSFHVRHRARQNPDPFMPQYGVESVQKDLDFARRYVLRCPQELRDWWRREIADLEAWVQENTYATE